MSANRWARPELSASPDWSASWSQKNGTVSSGGDRLAVPICCHWGDGPGARSVPVRVLYRRQVAATASQRSSWRVWTTSGNATSLWQGFAASIVFDLTAALREVVKDIVMRLPELAHIRLEQVHIGITRARRQGTGLLARITPMRFPGGKLWVRYGNTLCTIQRYWRDGVELLYLLAFCVPRFLDLSFDEKMVTILHELCHISHAFDGDLHRHSGRYCLHTHSKKAYDRRMALLARAYLNTGPDERLLAFLRLSSRELLQRYPVLVAEWLPNPRIIPWPVNVPPEHDGQQG